jgi:RluA family pseudouridine synthase
MMLSSIIASHAANKQLVAYLANRFTYLAKEEWQDRILQRRVLLNGMPCEPDVVVKTGDRVTYYLPDMGEPEADVNYRTVYEDEWIVAIDKPGNLLVHRAGRSITRNLVFLLRHASGNHSYSSIHAVSRLDRETSGLVLFAKNADCLRVLHRAFAAKTVEKEYVVIVHNALTKQTLTIDMPIGPAPASAVSYKFATDSVHGKAASTVITNVDCAGSFSLVLARPLTGRTHQIRVHCAAIGNPVVGDKLYGLSESDYCAWRSDPQGHAQMLEFPRQALHCRRLSFAHPATGEALSIEAPIPEDMSGLIKKLGLTLKI